MKFSLNSYFIPFYLATAFLSIALACVAVFWHPFSANKVFLSDELGVRFEYPSFWPDLRMGKYKNGKGAGGQDLQGTYYIGIAHNAKNAEKCADPSGSLCIFLPSGDFESFEEPVLNKMPIDLMWTRENFERNMEIQGSVKVFRRIGHQSLLVGLFSVSECFPSLRLSVVTPLGGEYPNFQVDISDVFYHNNSRVLTLIGESCDFEDSYTKLGKTIEEGQYSRQLEKAIQSASQITETVFRIKK